MDDNTPLMEAGIDSLSAVEFRNKATIHGCGRTGEGEVV